MGSLKMSQPLTKDEIHAIAKDAAVEGSKEVLKILGIDIESAEEIRHFQANMQWAFRFRRLSEKVGGTIIITITAGVLAFFGKLFVDWVSKNGS